MILWIHKVLFWSRELMFRLLIAPRPLTIPLRTMRRSRNWTKTILTCGQRHTTSFYLFLYLFRSCSGFFTFCVLAPPLYLCFCGWHLLFSLSPVFCVPCLSSPPFPILHHLLSPPPSLPTLFFFHVLCLCVPVCVCACWGSSCISLYYCLFESASLSALCLLCLAFALCGMVLLLATYSYASSIPFLTFSSSFTHTCNFYFDPE